MENYRNNIYFKPFFWIILTFGIYLSVLIVGLSEINQKGAKNMGITAANWCINHFEQYLTEQTLKDECLTHLIRYNVEHPDVVIRQILLESGNFTSNNFKKDGNALGMNQPLKRHTTSLHSNDNGFATYSSIETMILDYKIWQRDNAYNLNREDYYKVLQKLYAEDSNYVNKLKSIKL